MEKVEKRVHLNLKVLPDIKAGVERIAKRERRSESNVAEILLEWALRQFDRAGSTLTLIETMAPGQLRQEIGESLSDGGSLLAPNTLKNPKATERGRNSGSRSGSARASKLTAKRRKHMAPKARFEK